MIQTEDQVTQNRRALREIPRQILNDYIAHPSLHVDEATDMELELGQLSDEQMNAIRRGEIINNVTPAFCTLLLNDISRDEVSVHQMNLSMETTIALAGEVLQPSYSGSDKAVNEDKIKLIRQESERVSPRLYAQYEEDEYGINR